MAVDGVGAPEPRLPVRMGGLRRREALRGMAAAAVSLAGGLSAACGPAAGGTASSAQPGRTNPKTVVTFSPVPWEQDVKSLNALYMQVLEPFLRANPDIDVQLVYQPRGDSGKTAAAIAAGTAVDVFEDYQIGGALIQGGYLLDFSSYMKRDNADTTIFPQGQVDHFRVGTAQYALPVSIESVVAVVNLGILDEAGLKAPDDGWDYRQAEALFRQTTVVSSDPKKHRYGGSFYFYGSNYPEAYYLSQFGGGYVDAENGTHCTLGTDGSIACGEYIYPLLKDGICTTDWAYGGKFENNLLTVGLAGSFMLPQFAAMPASIKWRFYPLPKGPVAGTTFGSPAFYAIPRTTKVPEAAWRLLHWITFEPDFQVAYMKFGLLPPASLKLYPQWIDVVKAVAPPLRDKNLEAFHAYVQEGHGVIDPDFRYGTAQAFKIINDQLGKILGAGMSVREAFTQAAVQVDAYETTQAQAQASATPAAAK